MRRIPNPLRYHDWKSWAKEVAEAINPEVGVQGAVRPQAVMLARKYTEQGVARATEDGILIFDETQGVPQFSHENSWKNLLTGVSNHAIVERGTEAVDVTGEASVVFDQPFTEVPNVVVTPAYAGPDAVVASISAVTTAGFNISVRAIDGSGVGPASAVVNWQAVGD